MPVFVRGSFGGKEGALLWRKDNGNLALLDLQDGDEIPASFTALQPSIYSSDACQRDVWDESVGAWKAVPDYSQQTVYDKATGDSVPSLQVGVPMASTQTLVTPPRAEDATQKAAWDETGLTWKLVTVGS